MSTLGVTSKHPGISFQGSWGAQLLFPTSLFTLTWILFLGGILLFFPIDIPWLMYQLGKITEVLENFFAQKQVYLSYFKGETAINYQEFQFFLLRVYKSSWLLHRTMV